MLIGVVGAGVPGTASLSPPVSGTAVVVGSGSAAQSNVPVRALPAASVSSERARRTHLRRASTVPV